MGVGLLLLWGSSSGLPFKSIGFLAFFGGLIAISTTGAILYDQARDVCPHCGEWQSVEVTRSEVVEQKKCYGIVIRRGSSTSYGSMYAGPKQGTVPTVSHSESSWEERVPVIQTTTAHYHRCNCCRRKWITDEVDQVEDFDRR